MTTTRLLPAILTLSAICVHADDSTEPVTESSPEAELIALDDAWIDAEVHGDKAALERILHEEFLVTFASGRTVDRTTFIDRITENAPAPFKVTHEAIRLMGYELALINLLQG